MALWAEKKIPLSHGAGGVGSFAVFPAERIMPGSLLWHQLSQVLEKIAFSHPGLTFYWDDRVGREAKGFHSSSHYILMTSVLLQAHTSLRNPKPSLTVWTELWVL